MHDRVLFKMHTGIILCSHKSLNLKKLFETCNSQSLPVNANSISGFQNINLQRYCVKLLLPYITLHTVCSLLLETLDAR